jgi:hypothetical protein
MPTLAKNYQKFKKLRDERCTVLSGMLHVQTKKKKKPFSAALSL